MAVRADCVRARRRGVLATGLRRNDRVPARRRDRLPATEVARPAPATRLAASRDWRDQPDLPGQVPDLADHRVDVADVRVFEQPDVRLGLEQLELLIVDGTVEVVLGLLCRFGRRLSGLTDVLNGLGDRLRVGLDDLAGFVGRLLVCLLGSLGDLLQVHDRRLAVLGSVCLRRFDVIDALDLGGGLLLVRLADVGLGLDLLLGVLADHPVQVVARLLAILARLNLRVLQPALGILNLLAAILFGLGHIGGGLDPVGVVLLARRLQPSLSCSDVQRRLLLCLLHGRGSVDLRLGRVSPGLGQIGLGLLDSVGCVLLGLLDALGVLLSRLRRVCLGLGDVLLALFPGGGGALLGLGDPVLSVSDALGNTLARLRQPLGCVRRLLRIGA